MEVTILIFTSGKQLKKCRQTHCDNSQHICSKISSLSNQLWSLVCDCVYNIVFFVSGSSAVWEVSSDKNNLMNYLDVYNASIFKLICRHRSGVNILAIYLQGTTTQLPFYFHQIYFYHIITGFNKFKDYIRCCTRQMIKVKIIKVFWDINFTKTNQF